MSRKPKTTHPRQKALIDKIKGAGAKVKQLNIDSATANTGERNKHAVTDGRSSTILNNRSADVTSTANGRLGVNENGKISAKNAVTNLMTDKDNSNQSGRRKLSKAQKEAGQNNWQGNRRQRDYYVRQGLNNDQRSEEAIQRLRAAGLSDEEIGRGGGGGGWRSLTTG